MELFEIPGAVISLHSLDLVANVYNFDLMDMVQAFIPSAGGYPRIEGDPLVGKEVFYHLVEDVNLFGIGGSKVSTTTNLLTRNPTTNDSWFRDVYWSKETGTFTDSDTGVIYEGTFNEYPEKFDDGRAISIPKDDDKDEDVIWPYTNLLLEDTLSPQAKTWFQEERQESDFSGVTFDYTFTRSGTFASFNQTEDSTNVPTTITQTYTGTSDEKRILTIRTRRTSGLRIID